MKTQSTYKVNPQDVGLVILLVILTLATMFAASLI